MTPHIELQLGLMRLAIGSRTPGGKRGYRQAEVEMVMEYLRFDPPLRQLGIHRNKAFASTCINMFSQPSERLFGILSFTNNCFTRHKIRRLWSRHRNT